MTATRSSRTPTDVRPLLLAMIDEAYDKPTFNETNLRSSLSRITAAEAAWRPPAARRTIAEITVHCAYWKYAIRRRVTGEPPRGFPLRGANWPAIPKRPTAEQWSQYRALLDEEHRKLRQAVRNADLPLSERSRRGLFGIAMHDAYHTGQVRLIRAMCRRGGPARRKIS